MSKLQTDNSYFADKVLLRLRHLPEKETIKILDCFSGNGLIWDEVKKHTNKNIIVLRIEKESKKQGIYLKGDNLKFIKEFDLNEYDIIDIDAYGIPYKQLDEIFKKKPQIRIFVTFIQTMFGALPIKFIESAGYTRKMIKKIPAIFNLHGNEILFNYLALNGVKKIYLKQASGKRYFCFDTSGK